MSEILLARESKGLNRVNTPNQSKYLCSLYSSLATSTMDGMKKDAEIEIVGF